MSPKAYQIIAHNTFLTTLWLSRSPVHIKKISYTIFKLAFLLFFGTPGMSEDTELYVLSPDKWMAAAAFSVTSWAGTSLSTCLGHILHKPKKFQTKVFCLSYIYMTSKWYSQHGLNFGQESKKMHLNFGTCPHTQEADPNSNWDRYPRTKGLGKSGRAERIFQPVYELGAVGPPGWHIYSREAVPSNWHLSLPLLAEPASVPCSTVQPTGITWKRDNHKFVITFEAWQYLVSH